LYFNSATHLKDGGTDTAGGGCHKTVDGKTMRDTSFVTLPDARRYYEANLPDAMALDMRSLG
jgi:nucleoside phosphorylase